VGQLATRFNAMIEQLQHSRDALDESVRAQRQLVADASHELRTPITSLRTNIEVLLEQGDALSDDDRHRLLADVLEQSEELSALIGDVIELARGDLPISSAEDIRLDRIVAESVTRARRDFPQVQFETTLAPVIVEGVPERLARAVNNLLDNAAHHSPRDGVVEVVVDREGIRVRDHGTGIAEHDLPYVFDRFYRGANSRHRQGSGLGLAIVRQAAAQHGGSIEAANGTPVGGGRRSRDSRRYRLGGLASRAWRARRKRRRRNHAHAPNTAATGTSSRTRIDGVPTVRTITNSATTAGIAASSTVWER
jgi:two-component system sensor histidine kinase MprB